MGNEKFNPIRLRVASSTPDNTGRVFVVGVPLPAGGTDDAAGLCVRSGNGQCLPSVVEVKSRWSDGSIRWSLVKFAGNSATADIYLDKASASEMPVLSGFEISQHNGLTVTHEEISYRFTEGRGFPEILLSDVLLHGEGAGFYITDEEGRPCQITYKSPSLEFSDALSAVVDVEGHVRFSDDRELILNVEFHLFADNSFSVKAGIHNPQRAQHRDGIWDLGDPGSVLFERFALELPFADQDEILFQKECGNDWISHRAHPSISLYQASSGGEHWQSPAHVNRYNECRNEFCGYQLELTGGAVQSGARAEPAIVINGGANRYLSITPDEYWQNFPKKTTIDSSIEFDIFPAIAGDCHELQGGERKQHTFHFSVADNLDASKMRVLSDRDRCFVSVDAAAFEQAQVLGTPVGASCEPYEKLLEQSFDPDKGFFAKREQQDEFGWRNFGDVVADHETLYHDDGSYFISHYNNQYDCVYGFARQYLLTGDARWYRLMDELARHVVDIDIYHTDQDRAEYNHGLFWHTDHYQKASTASHRTYSKDHYADDWTGPRGGGPGPEHCYTSGLKTYYFLTGNMDARNAVIGMTSWIANYYEGTGTFVEFCKTLLSRDVKKLIASLRGQRVFKYLYPFDRGVGNYIRALLDSFELTGNQAYLDKAEFVIVNTFGAADDIEQRDLHDIEHTWYYTVFLQEVVRFLDTRREQKNFNAGFQHARDGLLHYATWMEANEQPYLEQPDKLEYPNDTWAAQEIRKANVLYAAYLYAVEDRQAFLKRACFFRDYVVRTLSKSDTLYFARIQALLLQNHGPSGLMDTESPAHSELDQLTVNATHGQYSHYRVGDFFGAVTSGLSRVVKTTNPKREYEWVRTRLGQ